MTLPAKPTSTLAGLCHDALVVERDRPLPDRKNWLGAFELRTLEALDEMAPQMAGLDPDLRELERLLRLACQRQLTEDEGKQVRATYERATSTAFPTSQAVLRWLHAFHGIAADHSLGSIDVGRVRELEVAAYQDRALSDLLRDLRSTLKRARNLDDSQAFRQAFENYGEAVVYSLLSRHYPTTKIAETSSSTPDFRCELPNGKQFFVELKTFDLVDGAFRAKEIVQDALDQQLELERQQVEEARAVSIAMREVDPFRKAATQPGPEDLSSLCRVIDVLTDKTRGAFKQSQFAQGPTIAFALCDRLIIPAGKHAVAPYYYESGHGAVVSGVLWHACFGKVGTPIFQLPDFDGRPSLEGHLTRDGLLVDAALPFHTGAIIFAETGWQEDGLFGLYDAKWTVPGWTPDDTEAVMHVLCTAANDQFNSHGQDVAKA